MNNVKICPYLLASGKEGLPNACLGKQCGKYNECNGIVTVHKPKVAIRSIDVSDY